MTVPVSLPNVFAGVSRHRDAPSDDLYVATGHGREAVVVLLLF
jgi:hypothetical protein